MGLILMYTYHQGTNKVKKNRKATMVLDSERTTHNGVTLLPTHFAGNKTNVYACHATTKKLFAWDQLWNETTSITYSQTPTAVVADDTYYYVCEQLNDIHK